jgi:hypothetical protein
VAGMPHRELILARSVSGDGCSDRRVHITEVAPMRVIGEPVVNSLHCHVAC